MKNIFFRHDKKMWILGSLTLNSTDQCFCWFATCFMHACINIYFQSKILHYIYDVTVSNTPSYTIIA